ncbi:VanW family protein [Clostridium sp.]|uniref:VanW family protein n=1 Tax=Clostridium sp. TaxID=1506 RepID=UPI00261AC98A|nr:VanW family protein [Clostridium sp.]
MENKNLNSKRIYIILGIIGTIILLLLGSYITYIKYIVDKWEYKVYPKVMVYGIDVSSLTKEEATTLLDKELSGKVNNKEINIDIEEKGYVLRYKDLDAIYDIQSIVNEALIYGKNLSLFERYDLVKALGERHEIESEIIYNKEKLISFEEELKSKVNVKALNANISINLGTINIGREIVGKHIDGESFHDLLVGSINSDPNEKLNLKIDLNEEIPVITEVNLKKITGRISSYNTRYNSTGDGRENNMKIASDTINGTLLMPGDTFSYNQMIGDTTPDKGYEKANTYVGKEIVPDYGGGICQISTTLYRAVMRANIRFTERVNHSMIVSYSEPGLDATVANDYIDYKFINTYDFPIYIESFLYESNAYVNIYGNIERLGNKTYELVNKIHEKYDVIEKYEEDDTLEEGKEKISVNGMPGYKVSSYLVTYEDGIEISREYIATDLYKASETIIKKGTKKAKKVS